MTDPMMNDDMTPLSRPVGTQRRGLTRKQKRRRIILVVVLALLLALLSYLAYYFNANRRLPSIGLEAPQEALAPPQYLYSITGQGGNRLERPVGIDIANGEVFVIDFGKSRVSVFNEQGRFLRSFNKIEGGKTLQRPSIIAIRDDEVWVSDRLLRELYIFDRQGKFLRKFQPKGEKLTWAPLAVDFASDGKFVVTDLGDTDRHKIEFFSADGSRTATVGRTIQANALVDEPGGFLFPSGVVIAPRGTVYVSDGDNRRLQVFGPTGRFQRFIDTSGVPRGSAIDSEGRLYVVDALAHTVDIYNLKGENLTQFGGQGFGPGQFNFPGYVAVNERGRIFVTDRENNQVQVWGWPEGGPSVITPPTTPLGWLACLSPFLLLPFLLLLRKRRVVVTPDFVEALIDAGDMPAVHAKRKLRLTCPDIDHTFYAGRVVGDIDLGKLIEPEEHSESDVRALMQRLELDERSAILISMAERAHALGTEDRELRRIAVLAEVEVVDSEEFRARYLLRRKS